MTDQLMMVTSTATGLLALALICAFSLSGWRDWIALKRHEIDRLGAGCDATAPHGAPGAHTDGQHANTRIELADLRERLRNLEAIAAGVDL